jgi:hypothetical protein
MLMTKKAGSASHGIAGGPCCARLAGIEKFLPTPA